MTNGFRWVPAIGVFGAAASASVLSGLDTRQFANALNFAANMAGGFYEGFADGTIEGRVHAGLAARAGITAAALARAGGETSPATLDGAAGFFNTFARGRDYDPGALTADTRELGILRARSKWFPACAVNQDTMLVIRSLRPAGFAPSEIERVVVNRHPASYDATGLRAAPPYHNVLQAQMSAKFTAVAALLGRPITEFAYFRDSFGDAQRTSLLADQKDLNAITVEVVLKGGATVTVRSADVADMSWAEEMDARIERLAYPRLRDAARSVRDAIANLESAPDIGGLTQLLRG